MPVNAAHKQGPRRQRERARRPVRRQPGTHAVEVFEPAAARTGLRDREATAAGHDPISVTSQADDHEAYYPGSHPITTRFTGDRRTGRLLGVQLVGHLRSRSFAVRLSKSSGCGMQSLRTRWRPQRRLMQRRQGRAEPPGNDSVCRLPLERGLYAPRLQTLLRPVAKLGVFSEECRHVAG